MMAQQTIRWQQRFNNYRKALVKLTQAVELLSDRIEREEAVDELLQEGLIQRFEYTHELAWKVMKDYAEYQGYMDVRGSRDGIRKALEMGLIDDKRWMETIEDRNLTYIIMTMRLPKKSMRTSCKSTIRCSWILRKRCNR